MIISKAVAGLAATVLGATLLAGCGADVGADGASADVVASAVPAPSGQASDGSDGSDGENHVMPDGSVMTGSEMDMSGSATPQPSEQSSQEPSASGDDYGYMDGDYSAQDVDGDGHLDTEGVDGQPSETATMVCADQIREAVKRTLVLRKDPVPTVSWDGTTYTCDYKVGGAVLRASVRDDTADTATAGRGYFDLLRKQIPGAAPLKGILALGFPAYESQSGHVVFLKDHKTLHVDTSALPASALPKRFTREDVAYAVGSAVMVCWTE